MHPSIHPSLFTPIHPARLPQVNTLSGNYVYTTPQLKHLVTGRGITTLVFTCPAPNSDLRSHCTEGMWTRVVVDHRSKKCEVPRGAPVPAGEIKIGGS
jgi:hypothetical protein